MAGLPRGGAVETLVLPRPTPVRILSLS